jgi:hypothetical protein
VRFDEKQETSLRECWEGGSPFSLISWQPL